MVESKEISPPTSVFKDVLTFWPLLGLDFLGEGWEKAGWEEEPPIAVHAFLKCFLNEDNTATKRYLSLAFD